MSKEEFRKRAKEMVDYVADYMETIHSRRPLHQVKPGYMSELVPEEAPQEPDQWDDVFADIERVVMPGALHWQSPHFHAYYGSRPSDPAVIAGILEAVINQFAFTWMGSPVGTEMEMMTTNWLAKLLQLPEHFQMNGNGGGVILSTSSEATLVATIAAKSKILRRLRKEAQNTKDEISPIDNKLVYYCSDQAHSSVERAGLLTFVKCHKIKSDEKQTMRGEALQAAILEDRQRGLVPFFCVATLGTTASCAFDNLLEIGPICANEGLWLHVDAAYAGAAFICPEFRPLLNGIEYADSFNFNAYKWLMVSFSCSPMWFRDRRDIVDAFQVGAAYYKHDHQQNTTEYHSWGIAFSHGFPALKLWFVLRLLGVKGLQEKIRQQVSLAKEFETLVKSNSLFEITNDVTLGLVCFRLKASNELNEALVREIQADGRIFLAQAEYEGIYFIRFCLSSQTSESKDILYAWKVIQEIATTTLNNNNEF